MAIGRLARRAGVLGLLLLGSQGGGKSGELDAGGNTQAASDGGACVVSAALPCAPNGRRSTLRCR